MNTNLQLFSTNDIDVILIALEETAAFLGRIESGNAQTAHDALRIFTDRLPTIESEHIKITTKSLFMFRESAVSYANDPTADNADIYEAQRHIADADHALSVLRSVCEANNVDAESLVPKA